MFAVFFNELYASTYRKLNFCFLIFGGLFIYLTIHHSTINGYIIHAHHYFIGLVFHMVCQTKKSKISVINNGIGLGVFLGLMIDNYLQTKPLMLIICFILGTIIGFYNMYKALKRYNFFN